MIKQNEKIRAEIDKLTKENDWYGVQQLLQAISTGVNILEKGTSVGLRTAFMFK